MTQIPTGEEIVKEYGKVQDQVQSLDLDGYTEAANRFVEAVVEIAFDEDAVKRYKNNIVQFLEDIPFDDLKYQTLRGIFRHLEKIVAANYPRLELIRIPLLAHVLNAKDAKGLLDWITEYYNQHRGYPTIAEA